MLGSAPHDPGSHEPEYADDEVVGIRELTDLYTAVGWLLYASDPDALARAVDKSSLVVTARVDGELVGLARALSDDVAVVYLQEVVVHPDHQRRGIGTHLVRLVRERYGHVRRIIADTAGENFQLAFAEHLGFTPNTTALTLERS